MHARHVSPPHSSRPPEPRATAAAAAAAAATPSRTPSLPASTRSTSAFSRVCTSCGVGWGVGEGGGGWVSGKRVGGGPPPFPGRHARASPFAAFLPLSDTAQSERRARAPSAARTRRGCPAACRPHCRRHAPPRGAGSRKRGPPRRPPAPLHHWTRPQPRFAPRAPRGRRWPAVEGGEERDEAEAAEEKRAPGTADDGLTASAASSTFAGAELAMSPGCLRGGRPGTALGVRRARRWGPRAPTK